MIVLEQFTELFAEKIFHVKTLDIFVMPFLLAGRIAPLKVRFFAGMSNFVVEAVSQPFFPYTWFIVFYVDCV